MRALLDTHALFVDAKLAQVHGAQHKIAVDAVM
jgi:hypothetical protein